MKYLKDSIKFSIGFYYNLTLIIALIILYLLFISVFFVNAESISAYDAKNFIGQTKQISGKVVGIKTLRSVTLVNLGKPYPMQVLTIVLQNNLQQQSTTLLESMLLNKCIQVSGKIELYHGKPQIKIYDFNQIIIIDNLKKKIPQTMTINNDNTDLSVVYNHPLRYDKPLSTSDSEIGKALISCINKAKNTIDFAIYGLRNQPEVIDALMSAKSRGVIVRGVVDSDIYGKNYYTDTPDLINQIKTIKTDHKTDQETLAKQEDCIPQPFWPTPQGFNGPPQCIGYSLNKNNYCCSCKPRRNYI